MVKKAPINPASLSPRILLVKPRVKRVFSFILYVTIRVASSLDFNIGALSTVVARTLCIRYVCVRSWVQSPQCPLSFLELCFYLACMAVIFVFTTHILSLIHAIT